ncbi:MAG: hypothetical protein HY744_19830 [Deltaproteobacteria bacterium]|nr:hypothetical protein [Deltaproteobacteria bacterium]
MPPPLATAPKLALCGALILLAAPALGDEERVSLEYRASAGCPSRDDFMAQVAARTSLARWVESPAAERRFAVAVSKRGRKTAGKLAIQSLDGAVATREVAGESCDEVVAALALVVALAIDPKARVEPTPAPASPAAAPGPVEPVGPAAPSAPASPSGPSGPAPGPTSAAPSPPAAAPAAAPLPPPVVAPAPAPVPVLSAPPAAAGPAFLGHPLAARAAARWRLAVGAGAAGTSGLGAKLSFVVRPAFADLTRHGPGWLAPSFRVAASYLPDRDVQQGGGGRRAELSRLAGELSGCPVLVRIHRALGVRPCVGLEAGALWASGGGVDVPADRVALWLAATVPVRLQYSPVDWALVEVGAELGVPILRQRFYFEPDATVLEVAPVYGAFGGDLGFRFR